MRLYHRTTDAAAGRILDAGFSDEAGPYLTDSLWSGVWLSNVPLGENEGATGEVLLEVTLDLPDAEIEKYEWVEEGKGFREFLIPAEVVNGVGRIRVVPRDEALSEPRE